ncbi:hypothetical protein WJX73_009374 [Symbiochloris irregularis]|uniref:Uncharacterized protein n=1 Tax=Symbiochloris irregularis TaxID=706552 RepID=A0AAW1P3R0_9CHLO
MPGLLQTPGHAYSDTKFVVALFAEFLGTMFFTFCGSATPTGSSSQQGIVLGGAQQANWAPWGNGIVLAVLVFATANISGGHLNPAVTAATLVTGHIGPLKGLMYMLVQLSGGCCGILLVAGLVPGARVGMGDSGIGCFHTSEGVTLGQLFGWELIMTFILVSVVYAVAVGEPHFGNIGPLAVGLTLFAMVFAGSTYTGTSVNPARSFGPAAVYHCYWNQVWLYCIAEFSGGILAGLAAGPLYGVGAPWLRIILPWVHPQERLQSESGKMVIDRNAEPDLSLGDTLSPVTETVSRQFWKRSNKKEKPTDDSQSGQPNGLLMGAGGGRARGDHAV